MSCVAWQRAGRAEKLDPVLGRECCDRGNLGLESAAQAAAVATRRGPPGSLEATTNAAKSPSVYSMRVSILNIGMYIAITITMPTMAPTPIISTGSMIEVSAWMLASTSSS